MVIGGALAGACMVWARATAATATATARMASRTRLEPVRTGTARPQVRVAVEGLIGQPAQVNGRWGCCEGLTWALLALEAPTEQPGRDEDEEGTGGAPTRRARQRRWRTTPS